MVGVGDADRRILHAGFKWASGLLRACARARDLYGYAAMQTELVA